MKNMLIVLGLIASVSCLSAQTTITQFNAAPTAVTGPWDGNNTTAGGIFSVTGGDSTGASYYDIGSLSLMGNALNDVEVTARLDSGNAASGFTVNFFDAAFNGVLTATFNAASFNSGGFTAAIASLSLYQGAVTNFVPIAYMGIAGNGTTDAFRISFDKIVANASPIPEPSTYAAIVGLLALGVVAYRRRLKAA